MPGEDPPGRVHADLSAWTPAQLEDARELIEDGGVIVLAANVPAVQAVSARLPLGLAA